MVVRKKILDPDDGTFSVYSKDYGTSNIRTFLLFTYSFIYTFFYSLLFLMLRLSILSYWRNSARRPTGPNRRDSPTVTYDYTVLSESGGLVVPPDSFWDGTGLSVVRITPLKTPFVGLRIDPWVNHRIPFRGGETRWLQERRGSCDNERKDPGRRELRGVKY